MKKIMIALILASLMLTGCGGETASGENESTGSNAGNTEQAQEASESGEDADLSSGSAGSSEEIPSATVEIFAMDTYMTLTGYGEQCQEAVDAAAAEIERLDALLSVGDEDSEIAVLNRDGSGTISEDTAIMLEESLSLFETTDGAFDITIYPLMVEWGFTSGEYHVPDSETLETLLQAVDASAIQYDADTGLVTLAEGQGVDFGGIAKGYTSGRIMEIFEEYGLVSGLVSLGGNVQCYSTKTDGSLWRCAISNPVDDSSEDFLGIVSVADKAVITSGGYERYFTDEETGEVYHHILDPETGYPANQGLISVTIVSENGMLADGLSTSFYIMGLDKATEYWQTYGDDFDMILMTEDQQVYITEGLEDSFTTDYPLTVITRD